MAIVARLLRGEPLELVARETNVSIARLSEWRERALAGAATALKERERDDRDDEIAQAEIQSGRDHRHGPPRHRSNISQDHFGLDGIDFEFSFDGVGPYLNGDPPYSRKAPVSRSRTRASHSLSSTRRTCLAVSRL